MLICVVLSVFECWSAEEMDVVDRLAPASIVQAVRKLSGTQEDIEADLQRPPPNEYFQQIRKAQQLEAAEVSTSRGLLHDIKDHLSPAGIVIGDVIRKLSNADRTDDVIESQTVRLQRIHDAAIAEQNRRGGRIDDEENSEDLNTLNLVAGIKGRFGAAVRRLSAYEEDARNKLSAREAFRFFQHTDSIPSGHTHSTDSKLSLSKKKKKRTWREIFSGKQQVITKPNQITRRCGNQIAACMTATTMLILFFLSTCIYF